MSKVIYIKGKCRNYFGIAINLFFSIVIIACTSCKKLVETPPPTSSITEVNVFSTDATAIAAVNNIYINMNLTGSGNPFQGIRGISLLAGLSADEMTLYSGMSGIEWIHYYHNTLSATMQTGSDQWAPLYNLIFKCNSAVEALTSQKSDALTPLIKKQLLGETQFMRGFFYFFLVNLYGDVPLCITTDPQENTMLARSPEAMVYQQIITDLLSAEENLNDNYLNGNLIATTVERVRPTKWAAKALLAKVYLYIGDFKKVEEKASDIINNTSLYGPLPPLDKVFLKNSREAIWQLQPTAINFNTQEAITFIIPANGPNAPDNPVYLSDNLLNSFEPNDQRAVYGNWIGTTIYEVTTSPLVLDTVAYAFKYKVNTFNPNITTSSGTENMTEYFMMLRLAEQYLIRAEARAQLGNTAGAVADLNVIRLRAGLTDYGGQTTQTVLLSAILQERRVELFTEGANRWFDLKRTRTIDAVMSVVTPQKSNLATTWQSYQQLCPIPLLELKKAPNLTQNMGY